MASTDPQGSARRRKGGWFCTASPRAAAIPPAPPRAKSADVGAPALGRLRAQRHVFSMVNPDLITAAFSLATCSENLTHLPGSASSGSLQAPPRCPRGAQFKGSRPRVYLDPINAANFTSSYSNLLKFKRRAYLLERCVGVTAAEATSLQRQSWSGLGSTPPSHVPRCRLTRGGLRPRTCGPPLPVQSRELGLKGLPGEERRGPRRTQPSSTDRSPFFRRKNSH